MSADQPKLGSRSSGHHELRPVVVAKPGEVIIKPDSQNREAPDPIGTAQTLRKIQKTPASQSVERPELRGSKGVQDLKKEIHAFYYMEPFDEVCIDVLITLCEGRTTPKTKSQSPLSASAVKKRCNEAKRDANLESPSVQEKDISKYRDYLFGLLANRPAIEFRKVNQWVHTLYRQLDAASFLQNYSKIAHISAQECNEMRINATSSDSSEAPDTLRDPRAEAEEAPLPVKEESRTADPSQAVAQPNDPKKQSISFELLEFLKGHPALLYSGQGGGRLLVFRSENKIPPSLVGVLLTVGIQAVPGNHPLAREAQQNNRSVIVAYHLSSGSTDVERIKKDPKNPFHSPPDIVNPLGSTENTPGLQFGEKALHDLSKDDTSEPHPNVSSPMLQIPLGSRVRQVPVVKAPLRLKPHIPL